MWSACAMPGATCRGIHKTHTIGTSSRSRARSRALHRTSCSGPGGTGHGSAHKNPDKADGNHAESRSSTSGTNSKSSPERGLEVAALQKDCVPNDKRMARRSCPANLAVASSLTLSTALALSGTNTCSGSVGAIAGAILGASFWNWHSDMLRVRARKPAPLRVVITGSSRGIGKALAREFLRAGDRVVVTSRSLADAQAAAAALVGEGVGGAPRSVIGLACDVGDAGSVEALAGAAMHQLGGVDVWINNAGTSGGFQMFKEQSLEVMESVVRTNLVGCLLCTRVALRTLGSQPTGGHVFNMDGAGAGGGPTPGFATYGATKAGIAQLLESVVRERAGKAGGREGGGAALHNLSPGMALTDLLLAGATPGTKAAFNVLCEQPETVAAHLVPRMRALAARRSAGGQYLRYLTPARVLACFLAAPLRRGRYFDPAGRARYKSEAERVALAEGRRRGPRGRPAPLALLYSGSIALSYLMLATQAHAQHGM
ncbi:NYC1 [Auxenochlorella protothecoides x Auxenochlorella symbiontica]